VEPEILWEKEARVGIAHRDEVKDLFKWPLILFNIISALPSFK